jgi:hypothetical protein
MGLDLRLLPCEHWQEDNGRLWGYSHTILELGGVDRDEYLSFEKMVKPHLAKLPTGHNISSFVGALVSEGHSKGEHLYGTIRDKNAYGTAYEVITAQHLLPWLEDHFRYDGHRGYGPYQVAVVAFIRALPPDTKIVLDWH